MTPGYESLTVSPGRATSATGSAFAFSPFSSRFLSSSIVQAAHAEPFHSVPSHHTHTHTHSLSLSLSLSHPGSCGADMILSPLPFAPPAFLRERGHALDHLLDQPSNSHLQRGLPTCITTGRPGSRSGESHCLRCAQVASHHPRRRAHQLVGYDVWWWGKAQGGWNELEACS